MSRLSSQSPSLWPREHGAYVQLLAPLLAILLFVSPSGASIAWMLMAVCLFLLHEPVLVLLGRRGQRARSELAVAARHRIEWLGAGAAVFGLGGVLLAPPGASPWLVLPIALSLVCASLLLQKREKSVPGQLLVAATLTSFALPAVIAAGVPSARAVCFVGSFAAIHALGALTARGAIYRKQDGGRLLRRAALLALGLLATFVVLHAQHAVPLAWALVPLPFAFIAVPLALRWFSPRSPKPLGWALTSASCIALLLLGLGM
jgi:hypothetical protein